MFCAMHCGTDVYSWQPWVDHIKLGIWLHNPYLLLLYSFHSKKQSLPTSSTISIGFGTLSLKNQAIVQEVVNFWRLSIQCLIVSLDNVSSPLVLKELNFTICLKGRWIVISDTPPRKSGYWPFCSRHFQEERTFTSTSTVLCAGWLRLRGMTYLAGKIQFCVNNTDFAILQANTTCKFPWGPGYSITFAGLFVWHTASPSLREEKNIFIQKVKSFLSVFPEMGHIWRDLLPHQSKITIWTTVYGSPSLASVELREQFMVFGSHLS